MASFPSLQLPPPSVLQPTQTHLPLSCTIEDLFLNSTTSVRVLNSCAAQRDLRLATGIHAGILKSGLHAKIFVDNALLNAYAKCGHTEDATKLFDRMPERDVVSWTSLVSGHCHDGAADVALSVFRNLLLDDVAPRPNEFTLAGVIKACALKRDEKTGEMVHGYLVSSGFSADPFIHNSLISMYSKTGSLPSAEKLIGRMGYADVVSWTSIISGCVVCGLMEKALVMFLRMLGNGLVPTIITMLSIIHACSVTNELRFFGWVHSLVIKLELNNDVLVVNSLLEMYSKNGFVNEATKVFGKFYLAEGDRYPSSEAMAALVHCCTHSCSLQLGEGIHGYLIKRGFFPCTVVENSLMNIYAKHDLVDLAHQLFLTMEDRDIISWNTMISCFVKNARAPEALRLLTEVHSKCGCGVAPDSVTMMSSLQACSDEASLQQGQILHGYVIRAGFGRDIFVGNALLDMYSKSGRIDFAEKIFEDMDVKDLGSWNSMIAAYGIHGDGYSALRVFSELKRCGIHQPNAITFVNIIFACGHSGLTEEGGECFKSMSRDYGIEPGIEHYVCMVNLLARSGQLDEAVNFISNMHVRPSAAVWGSLLGSCAIFGNVDIAEIAAERVSILEPNCNVWRVALSNVYSSAGRWELAAKVRAETKAECSRKEAGWSSVQVRGAESFRFMVADTRHPESMKIYGVLNGINEHITDASLCILIQPK